jgi:hypothetical protein
MAKVRSFRVGKVQAFLRGQSWYLCYHEQGRRHRPRVGPDLEAAKQLAAQINGQLAVGAPAALSFEPIPITTLRELWLEHHEQVLRSSVQTGSTSICCRGRALGQPVVAIHRQGVETLFPAVWPNHGDVIDLIRLAESKDQATVVCGEIAASADGVAGLRAPARREDYLRPHHVGMGLVGELNP